MPTELNTLQTHSSSPGSVSNSDFVSIRLIEGVLSQPHLSTLYKQFNLTCNETGTFSGSYASAPSMTLDYNPPRYFYVLLPSVPESPAVPTMVTGDCP